MQAMAKGNSSFGSGPGMRQLRVGEQIRRTMSELLMRGDIHDPDLNHMSITVGEVRLSADLRVATVYVLPLGGEGKEDAIRLLARHQGELRRLIGRKCGLKHAPELRFRLDETFDRMDETRRLLSQDEVARDLDGRDDAGDEEE